MLVGVVQVMACEVGLFAVGAGLENCLVVLDGLLAGAGNVAAVACCNERAALELDACGGAPCGVFEGLGGFVVMAKAVQALAEPVVSEVDVGGGEVARLGGLIDECAISRGGIVASA